MWKCRLLGEANGDAGMGSGVGLSGRNLGATRTRALPTGAPDTGGWKTRRSWQSIVGITPPAHVNCSLCDFVNHGLPFSEHQEMSVQNGQ